MREEASLNLGGKGVMLTENEIAEVVQNMKITESSVHPDTNEVVPFFMRMSGFVLFNTPILLASLFIKNQSPASNAVVQVVNQTYNAGMNYGNRNASSEYTLTDMGKGYGAAVVTSAGIAIVSRTYLAASLKSLKGPRFYILNAFLNYLCAAFAGAANMTFMRYKELQEGVELKNMKGDQSFGKSVIAGKKAVYESALTRVVLPFNVIFFPSIALSILTKLRLAPKGGLSMKLTEMTLCIMALTVSLPASVALFKQQATLRAEDLEDKFKELKDAQGEEVKEFRFNKGL